MHFSEPFAYIDTLKNKYSGSHQYARSAYCKLRTEVSFEAENAPTPETLSAYYFDYLKNNFNDECSDSARYEICLAYSCRGYSGKAEMSLLKKSLFYIDSFAPQIHNKEIRKKIDELKAYVKKEINTL